MAHESLRFPFLLLFIAIVAHPLSACFEPQDWYPQYCSLKESAPYHPPVHHAEVNEGQQGNKNNHYVSNQAEVSTVQSTSQKMDRAAVPVEQPIPAPIPLLSPAGEETPPQPSLPAPRFPTTPSLFVEETFTVHEGEVVMLHPYCVGADGRQNPIQIMGWMDAPTRKTFAHDRGSHEVNVVCYEQGQPRAEKRVRITVLDGNHPPIITNIVNCIDCTTSDYTVH